SLRDYQVNYSANVLGYISEVNEGIIEKSPYYQKGEIIGAEGVEKVYEEVLRGVKGVSYIQKDRFNRNIGSYENGRFDTLPVRGKDIILTIDGVLQKYGESLMVNKRGGIVALEPATGEILALVAAPNYDPGLLVGRERSKNFTKLYYDTIAKPLFDRVLSGEYPPGSPFKALTALIGLQEGVIDINEKISCHGSYNYGGRKPLGCHHHRSPLSLIAGIGYSCNSYFATVYRRTIDKFSSPREGMDKWKSHLSSFGLGQYMGHDLPAGRRGKIPSSKTYDAMYPNNNWYTPATISNAIGQGEILMTPMQMANFTAAIANRGWYYKPHVIKNIVGVDTIPSKYNVKYTTTIDSEHFGPVIDGMFDVYNYGTASHLQVEGIEICGKTGTAENYTVVNGKRMQLTDHSVFIAFAPRNNPKIAIAVFVENGYWGSRWAGRIASLMIEKYINDEITRTDLEDFILNGSLEEEYAKPYSDEPFSINH
ncbi:MAG: penicillin-binding protein 2, partial [Flavobacteriaceae bacterium]|nr:penicillin-binding protein 2 [Flavobacteriaceae bacterium]